VSNTQQTILDIITSAYRLNTVIDEVTPPSAEQGQAALVLINDMMANMQADLTASLGWYPQTDITSRAPLQDQDVMAIKFLLAVHIALNFGIKIEEDLAGASNKAYTALVKRYINYVDSDLTGLPYSQGGLFGPGRI
jgi:hypothetical protein